MRKLLMVALGVGFFGCSGGVKIDDTPNQTAQASNYVPGPFGYVVGSVMENLQFVGKTDPGGFAGTAKYADLPMTEFSLADYYNDKSVKYVVLFANAGWCKPCNDEQPSVRAAQAEYEPKGFRFVEGLLQGFDARSGAVATAADIDRWAARHNLHLAIGLDPQGRMFQYADVAAFPLNMTIRTSDMQIVYMSVGQQDIGTILAGLP